MSNSSRDEFTDKVKRTIAERAAYICSNPTCRRPTVGPHSDPGKSLKTGRACHIRAAAPGGARFDESQTADQRRAIENAIWLCAECADVVDKDQCIYPVGLLTDWKHGHETWIQTGGIIPSLPTITLETLPGLSIPDEPSTLTQEHFRDLREHSLMFLNASDVEISGIDARLQLPLPVVNAWYTEIPAGVNSSWTPIRPQMQGLIKGGGSITRNRPPLPPTNLRLQIDRLGARRSTKISFQTSTVIHEMHDFPFDKPVSFWKSDDPDYLLHFIEGKFQFQYRGATLDRTFFAPIKYEREQRSISISDVSEDEGHWKIIVGTVWS